MKNRTLTRKFFVYVAALILGALVVSIAIAQARSSSISLNSPVSFPVDI